MEDKPKYFYHKLVVGDDLPPEEMEKKNRIIPVIVDYVLTIRRKRRPVERFGTNNTQVRYMDRQDVKDAIHAKKQELLESAVKRLVSTTASKRIKKYEQ